MPRVSKQDKLKEIYNLEGIIARNVAMCLGYDVNKTNNVIDEFGANLVFGKEGQKKFVKWDYGQPLTRKEIMFDPVNNYQFMSQLFANFMEQEIQEPSDDEKSIKYVRSITLKDGPFNADGISRKKYVDMDIMTGRTESEMYNTPTLGFIEIMFDLYGILPFMEKNIKRLDELKYELQQ